MDAGADAPTCCRTGSCSSSRPAASAVEHLGRPVPSPLVVGPDPFAPPDEQLHQEDGALVVPDELLWMADFDRAVADGLGFKVDLSPERGDAAASTACSCSACG